MISENPYLRLIFFLGMLVLMFLAESLRPERSWNVSRWQRVKFSLGLALINNLVVRGLIAVPFLWFAHFVEQKGWGLSNFLGLSGLPEIFLTVILFDFLDAIKHRWFHRIPLMWRFHRVHHTDRHLDVLTALRYHPGEMIISAGIKAVWIFLWGPSALAFLVFEIALNLSSEFHHTNIHLGALDKYFNKVFVTPRYHAIHHTINRDRGDQNFTTIFSMWDRVLGTYTPPETTPVKLENLGRLQDNDISLVTVLRSPLESVDDH